MSSILVINAAGPETRVALVENGTISEFYLERKKDKGIVGNIYKGKVVRVLPGMQAAFVDIGLEKAAFLYVADVAGGPDFSEEFELAETPEGEHGEPPAGEVPAEDTADLSPGAVAPAPELAEPDVEAVEEAGELPEGEPTAVEAAPPEGELAAPEGAAPEIAPAHASAELPATAGLAAIEAASMDAAPAEAAAAVTPEPAPEATPADAGAEATAPEAPAANGSRADAPEVPPTPPAVAAAKEKGPRAPAQKGQIRAKALEPLARKRRRTDAPAKREAPKNLKSAQIQDLLKEGQEVIVQVVKDPIGTKGARVTCHISLPGRHLVFMPTVDHVGISRRVENEKERRRLRDLVEQLRPPGTGFIVRTVAEGIEKEKLVADIKFLLGLWNEMAHKKDRLRAPALLHPDLDLILRSIRDLFSAEVEKLVIDDRAEYDRIAQFVDQNVPQLKSAIELYEGNEPIFDAYGIEQELTRALSRKVWLKSGGYLIIDQAEALVAVDVNSGRFVGKKNLEETITAINIEAAKEIVYQLRLRNIGGIIIIDFIDMEKQQNREKVFKALQEALQKDRAKTNIVKISELGLVEMTRKRVRESVNRLLHEPCANCDGRGYLKSKVTVAYEIFREAQREGTARREDTLVISCHPEVARYVQTEEREALRHLMMRYNKTITVKAVGTYHQEQFDLVARWTRRDEQKDQPAPKKERPQQQPAQQAKEREREREREKDREKEREKDREKDREKEREKEEPRPPAPQPAAAPVVAANVAAPEEEEGEEEEEGPEVPAGAAGAVPGAPAQPGQPSGRRRRRRRRGRGGGGGGGGGQAQGQQSQPGAQGGGAPVQARPPGGGE